MDTGKIKELIEAFYNGDTTADEEQLLFDYFNSDSVAEELLDEQKIFLQMYRADDIEVPARLEAKLSNLIDDLSRQEEKVVETKKRNLWRWAGSIAAGIAILVFAGIHFNNTQPTVNTTMANLSVEDQQKMEEAEKALLLLSSNFNKGVGQLSVVSENIDKTNEILNKALGQ